MSKTEEFLKAAFAGESQTNRRYLAFASKPNKKDFAGSSIVSSGRRSGNGPRAQLSEGPPRGSRNPGKPAGSHLRGKPGLHSP